MFLQGSDDPHGTAVIEALRRPARGMLAEENGDEGKASNGWEGLTKK
jgi:hypothetical protein